MRTVRFHIDKQAELQPDKVYMFCPEPGIELTYRVSCDMQESDYDNNEVTHMKRSSDGPPGHDSIWIWGVVLILVVLLLSLFILRTDYMDRIRGR